MALDMGAKILNLSSYDHGGAGTASVMFNNYLINNGYFSKLMVRDTDNKNKDVIHYKKKHFPYIPYKIRRKKYIVEERKWWRLKRENKFNEIIVFDDQNSMASAKSILTQAGFKPDVIFIHWIHNFITPKILADLETLSGAKIVGIMMDNALITGGCHYPFSCKGYVDGCGSCPLFSIPTDFPSRILEDKEAFYPKGMEFWGTTSDCARVETSLLGRTRKSFPILFPIDETIISKIEKKEIRGKYNISQGKKLLMIGCTTFNAADNRKGYEYLISILVLITEKYPELKNKIALVLVGENEEGILNKMGYDILNLGYIGLDKLMEVYKMSDLFLSTSIEDSGPLMVNQAIATGTPVAAFDIGVTKDLVVDGETGFIADLFDFDTLAVKIGKYLSTEDHDMAPDCKAIFRRKSSEMSPIVQLNRILNN